MGLWYTTGSVGIQVEEETLEACHIHETINVAKLLSGNDRLGKTRDLFRKIEYIKGVFHAYMGTIKDRKCMNLKEVEDIKDWWQEYIEELSKKIPMTQITKIIKVITHVRLDILECKIKWLFGSITTNKDSGGDGIPAELFQILKDDTVEVLHSVCQKTWKTQQWLQDWKRSVFHLKSKEEQCKRIFKVSHNCPYFTH